MAWVETTLGEVLPFKYGKNLPAAKRSHSGEFDVVTSAGVVDSHCEPFVDRPSIVIGRKGTVGSLTYCANPCWPTDTAFYTTGSALCDLRFGYYFLQTLPLTEMNTDSAVPGLNRGEAEALPVRIPGLGKQEQISSVLGSLDDKIAANNHILGIIDETIQSLWKRAVRARATYTRLDEVIGINPRTPLPKGTLARKVEMKNLPEAGFSISEWEEHEAKGGSRYRNGDTLLARITPCFENGKCGFVDFLEADAVGAGSTEFIVMRPHSDIPPAAPYAVARSADFRAFAAQTMTGTSGRQRVQARDLEAYETVWPNGEQLSSFSSRTTPLLDFAGKLRDEAQVLAKTRDELLPLLMNGKITVREAGQEAAAAGAHVPSEENEV